MENGPTIIIPHIIVPINYNNTSTGHTNHPSLASDGKHTHIIIKYITVCLYKYKMTMQYLWSR